MLKLIFNTMMEHRAQQLHDRIGIWLPTTGPVLDVGSGTGHLSVYLEQTMGLKMVPADVTDMHVVGRPPTLIGDDVLPFETGTFSAALLCFMLAYPPHPVALLREVARVTYGPIIVVQSLYAGRLGYGWLRMQEFLWTMVAFYVSKIIGYIPPHAKFTMQAQRFYTSQTLTQTLLAAGLRIQGRQAWPRLPQRRLIVAGWRV
jgi:ubiquinone/menaquinone biosynthesis C-methylase UbiE